MSDCVLQEVPIKTEFIESETKEESYNHTSSEDSGSSEQFCREEPEKRFVCDTCTFSSPDRKLLRRHWIEEHDPSNEFCCPRKYCRSRFKTNSELDLHGKTHERTTAPTTSLLCHICSKYFPTTTQMKAHLKTHQEKNFCCDICGSKFKTRQEVDNFPLLLIRETFINNEICPG